MLHLSCPSCHNLIELPEAASLEQISCPSCGSKFRLVPHQGPTLGPSGRRQLGKFELLEEVGLGGFCIVYKARTPDLPRVVALKVPRDRTLESGESLERFLREGRALASLRHPAIETVYETGQADGLPYLVSEYVQGVTLQDRLHDCRPTFRKSAELIAAIAEALQYAHDHGVVHRDIKPANIMLDEEGKPRLIDFGLARRDTGETTITEAGQVLGTPAYMSPEQAKGAHRIDARSDIYSLGVTLYQLLTGELPFRGANNMVIHQVLTEEPKPPRSLNDKIPKDLETICLKAMAKEPGRRYQTAREFAEDLGRFLNGEPIKARPVGRVEKAWRWCRRKPALAAAYVLAPLALVLSVLGGSATWLWRQADAARRDAETARTNEASARRELQEAHEQLQASAFVSAAYHDWQGGNVVLARHRLEKCPTRLRAWEWDFVHSLSSPELLVLRGHTKGVTCVAYSPEGRRLASGSHDLTVKVWDAANGRELLSLEGHTGDIGDVAFSPDGRLLASASDDKTVLIWDAIHGGKPLRMLKGHSAGVSCAIFSPDREHLASAGYDGTVRIWRTSGNEAIKILKVNDDPKYSLVSCLAYSPDGRQLATGGFDRTVRVWDVDTGKQLWKITQPHQLAALSYSPDGKRLAMSTADPTIVILEASTGNKLQSLKGHNDPVPDLAFSPDGRYLASGGFDWTVRIWDTNDGSSRTLRGHTGKVVAVAFSPTGREVASASFDGMVRVWDSAGMLPALGLRADRSSVEDLAFSPDSKRLVYGGTEGTVYVVDVADGRKIHILKGERARTIAERDAAMIHATAYRPDGRQIASATQGYVDVVESKTVTPSVLKLWDARSGEEILSLKDDKVYDLAYSPNSRLLASGHQDGTVKLRDADTGEVVRVLRGHEEAVAAVAFSPDGSRLASASFDTSLKIWDATTGATLLTLRGSGGSLKALAYSPDGRLVASGGEAQTIDIWDAATGRLLRTLVGHIGSVHSLTFTPDSKRLASGGGDRIVRIWDANTGEELLSLKEEWAGLPSMKLAFSPDGRRLAVALDKGELKIWLAGETAEEREQRRYSRTLTEVANCEEVDEWYAAAFHLRRLLRQKPSDTSLQARLHRAEGMLHAEQEEWAKAGAEFRDAVKRWPTDPSLRRCLALACLGGNDLLGYQQACAQAIQDFKDAATESKLMAVAHAALLPDSGIDAAALVSLTETLVQTERKQAMARYVFGAALYRAGRYQDALAQLEAALEAEENLGNPLVYFLLAMTNQRLGQAGEAMKWFQEGCRAQEALRKESQEPGKERLGWHLLLMIQLLREEAEQTLPAKR